MATFRVPIMGWQTIPHASNANYFNQYDAFATNDVWSQLVAVWEDSAADRTMRGAFEVPSNYASTPEIVVIWTSATSGSDPGDVVWKFDYRVVSGDDEESLDQTLNDEDVSITATAPSADHERLVDTISLTASHWSLNATCEYKFSRDGTNSNDDLADDALVFELMFSYSDT